MPICALCEVDRELRTSHIVPAFVYNWLKGTSPGSIRRADAPNLRIQDGIKLELLCEQCEQRFSQWEREFAATIFAPMHNDGDTPLGLRYDGTWMLKFCVSVSWRVLEMGQQRGLNHLSDQQRESIQAARTIWKRFLRGELPHPRAFEQHLIPLDVIEDHSLGEISPFLNRYLTRTIDIDIVSGPDTVHTYAKMGRALLIGIALPANRRQTWSGTKVHVARGTVGDNRMTVPGWVSGFLNRKADRSMEAMSTLSPPQREKIQRLFKERADRIAGSDVHRAMSRDVALTGDLAFFDPDEPIKPDA